MENKLRALFDFQKFDRNADLQNVIDNVHARYSARMLTDEEADMVNAAGVINTGKTIKPPKIPIIKQDENGRS